jgi:hypothetical protein
MKKSLVIIFLFSAIVSFSQNVPIDFENSGNGLNWTWTTFENSSNPPLEIIQNPDPSGINTSSTVAKFTALQSGAAWAGCESMHGSDIGSFSLNSNNCTVTIMVWKPVISDVGIKFVDANSAAQVEIKVANTLINQWEELTFDFSSRIGVFPIVKDQIVIFPDFDLGGRTQDNVIYFDNVYGSSSTSIEGARKEQLSLYPNPANEMVNVNIKNYEGITNTKVYNLMGNLLLNTSSKQLDIKNLSQGIYLFKVTYGDKSEVIKLTKE